MPVFHLAGATLCTCSENSNKVRNVGSICGGLGGHQPKVEIVADMSVLHKRFVAQHKMDKIRQRIVRLLLMLVIYLWRVFKSCDGPGERQSCFFNGLHLCLLFKGPNLWFK